MKKAPRSSESYRLLLGARKLRRLAVAVKKIEKIDLVATKVLIDRGREKLSNLSDRVSLLEAREAGIWIDVHEDIRVAEKLFGGLQDILRLYVSENISVSDEADISE